MPLSSSPPPPPSPPPSPLPPSMSTPACLLPSEHRTDFRNLLWRLPVRGSRRSWGEPLWSVRPSSGETSGTCLPNWDRSRCSSSRESNAGGASEDPRIVWCSSAARGRTLGGGKGGTPMATPHRFSISLLWRYFLRYIGRVSQEAHQALSPRSCLRVHSRERPSISEGRIVQKIGAERLTSAAHVLVIPIRVRTRAGVGQKTCKNRSRSSASADRAPRT